MPDTFTPYNFSVRPRHLETLNSYSRRLLEENFETATHQRTLLRGTNNDLADGEKALGWADIISAKTGRDVSRLTDTPTHSSDHKDGSMCELCLPTGPRYLCTHCAHGAQVEQHPHFDTNVCLTHRRWVGPDTTPGTQRPVGHPDLAAELTFRKLRRKRKLDLPLFTIAMKATDTSNGPSYAEAMRLAARLTSDDFARRFFDPSQAFGAAHTYLASSVSDFSLAPHAIRSLWLYFRPTFLSIRESLDTNRPYARFTEHDFPVNAAVVNSFRHPVRPLEPFQRYLNASDDSVISEQNCRALLSHRSVITPRAKPGHPVRESYICRAGHRQTTTLRTLLKLAASGDENCAICHRRTVLAGHNDLTTTHPTLAREFHQTRNGNLRPEDILAGSSVKIWWRCNIGTPHEFLASPSNRTSAESSCPVCLNRVIIAGVNDLRTSFPTVARMWNFAKNFNHNIDTIAAGSNAFLFWICDQGHTFRNTIGNMTRGASCHQCAKLVRRGKSLIEARPDLAGEWDVLANLPLTVDTVTVGSQREVAWTCPEGHAYSQRVERRVKGYRCPLCSGRKCVPGINDVATRYPEISSEWHSSMNCFREPCDIVAGTKLYWWECRTNRHVYQQSVPHRVKSKGCPICPTADRILPVP